MTFDERAMYLLLGVAVGFILGYATRILLERTKEDHSMSELNVDPSSSGDESGVVGETREGIIFDRLKNWALLLVVLLTAFAAFRSQAASNDADEAIASANTAIDKANKNQEQLEKVVGCLIVNQTALLNAVNTRTGYTQAQAKANKELQEAQSAFFDVLLHIPPYSERIENEAARTYQSSLDDFLVAASASESNAKITEYPEAQDLRNCIERVDPAKEK